jgi:predicted dehydrogenase
MIHNTITRRRFMHGVATTSAAVFAGPYVLRAAEPNREKLRIAFVGTGGRAGSHVQALDLKTETCPCYADVDRNRWKEIARKARDAKAYQDWRQMFDRHEKEIDAVFVAIPDHSHAAVSMRAIKAGKACYTEKPMAWAVQEARVLAEAARDGKVPTQMGNQGHAREGNRRIVEWVRAGLIGDVLEVHTWTNRPVWPQGKLDIKEMPPPANLDWDLWIGPAAMRPYAEFPRPGMSKFGNSPYHPWAWRGWFDFGCGAIGDMGCHTFDNVFWSMAPDYPSSVELLEVEEHTDQTYPLKSHFKWTFPEKYGRKGFEAHWYEGGLKPSSPEEILSDPYDYTKVPGNGGGGGGKKKAQGVAPGAGKDRLPRSGNLYVWTKGKMLVIGDYGDEVRLLPSKVHEQTQFPAPSIPRSPGHREEFIMAARGERPWDSTGSNFPGYAGALTEVMLLGNICQRIGKVGLKIECDAAGREVKTEEARQYLRREYRKGWEL